MKRLLAVIFIALVAILVVSVALSLRVQKNDSSSSPLPRLTNNSFGNSEDNEDIPRVSLVAEGLDTPWAIVFLPDSSMLVTERKGTVRLIDSSSKLQKEPVATISSAQEIGEGGLLGMVLDPEFENNSYVYLYYTYSGGGANTQNRVVRMTYENNTLSDEEILVDEIPGASNHNGGRIAFGPDGYLYITTGDASEPSLAQDRNSLAGKILRVKTDGSAADGNPFGNRTYSYGHRNPQGLAWDSGNLWSTEHGPSGIQSGNDEINRIAAGDNYGWPEIVGQETRSGMQTPVRESGRSDTWAPGGAAFVGNSLFFGGLRGEALYEAEIENEKVLNIKEHFKNEYGRIREVIKGPDGMLYITTSNRDGRGDPEPADDRIIRVNPYRI